jgi:hypothetical protein
VRATDYRFWWVLGCELGVAVESKPAPLVAKVRHPARAPQWDQVVLEAYVEILRASLSDALRMTMFGVFVSA